MSPIPLIVNAHLFCRKRPFGSVYCCQLHRHTLIPLTILDFFAKLEQHKRNYSYTSDLKPWSSFSPPNVECGDLSPLSEPCGDESPHSTNSPFGLNDDQGRLLKFCRFKICLFMDSIACIRANSNGFILATIISVHRQAVCSTSHIQWKMFCSGRCFCLRTLSKSWSKTAGSHCLVTWPGNIKGMNCKGQTTCPASTENPREFCVQVADFRFERVDTF